MTPKLDDATRRRRVLIALTLAAAVAQLGCGPREATRPNVILIVVDTLRASHLGCYGYARDISPFLDSVAMESLRFERAIATASWTSPSVASIFTSLYPPALGITRGTPKDGRSALVLDDAVLTLAEILQGEGYQTLGVVANPWIAKELGYAQGFDKFFRARRSKKDGHATADRVNRVVYEELSAGNPPFFLYLQYMDPHKPYHPQRLEKPLPPLPVSPDHAADARRAKAIDGYDSEIRYLDSELKELFAFLRKKSLYENSVIVVTADHGEQIYEYGHHDHGHTLHNLEIHVPLLIKIPGTPARPDDTIVSTVDIAPTILDALGIEIDHPVQGVSLLRELEIRRERGVFSGLTYWGEIERSFTRGDGKKLIVSYGEPGASDASVPRRFDTFDSIADYEERLPLETEELEADLRFRFDDILSDSLSRRSARAPRSVELDEESVEQLKQLGYLE